MKTDPNFIGAFQLGFRNVRLYTQPKSGGSVFFNPEDNGTTRINVGLDDPWNEVVATLLHELYELSLVEMNARYELNPGFSYQTSRFMFMVGHDNLDECHSRVGLFLFHCLKPLEKRYDEYIKQVKAEARKKKK